MGHTFNSFEALLCFLSGSFSRKKLLENLRISFLADFREGWYVHVNTSNIQSPEHAFPTRLTLIQHEVQPR